MKKLSRTASLLSLLLSAAWLAGFGVPVTQAQTCSSSAMATRLPGVSGRPQNGNDQVYIAPEFQGEARIAIIEAFTN